MKVANITNMANTTEPKAMKKVDLFVPLAFNDGAPIPAGVMELAEEAVVTLFGGCTLHFSLTGVWVNGAGTLYRDPIMIIEIVTEDQSELVASLIELAAFVRKKFEQEEIFFTIRDVDRLLARQDKRSEMKTFGTCGHSRRGQWLCRQECQERDR